MFVESLIDAFADDRFVSLTNYGDRWGIKWKPHSLSAAKVEGANVAEVFDDTLERLCETFVAILDSE